MPTQVIKRDGRTEPFDPQKIARVTVTAGLDPRLAAQLAQDVSDWLHQNRLSSVTSLQLRDLVTGKLHSLDETAARMFVSYQHTKTSSAR